MIGSYADRMELERRERERQQAARAAELRRIQEEVNPWTSRPGHDVRVESPDRLKLMLRGESEDQFPVDKIAEHKGMMGSRPDSQRNQMVRHEAEADFKRLFDGADPGSIYTPEEKLEDRHTEMQRGISQRNTQARNARLPVGRPSEEVSQRRIAENLRNKLTGQVDELSNADGRLGLLNAANERARVQREEEDKAHISGVRRMFALQDENKAMGRVPHRDRVTNNITPKRVMERRQNVRNYRENQQIAAGIFQENKKIAAEQAAEEARKQAMLNEDMRQGGRLGIIRDKLAGAAAAEARKAVSAENALDREDANARLDREIEARLEAARISAGGRGDDTDKRTRDALSAETGANQAIMNNPMASQADRDAAMQRNVDIAGQLKSMNTRDNPQPAPPSGEAGIKFRKTEELKNALLSAEDPRAAATLIRDAVDAGYINETEAAVMAGGFGENTGRLNDLSSRYNGWMGPAEWLYDKFTGNL